MTTTRVFRNGNSQAIRIPQEMRTTEKEFLIARVGDAYIAYPAGDPWLPAKQAVGAVSEDFMEDRMQPGWETVPTGEEL